MNNKAPLSPRARAQILADIASLPNAVQGKICSYANRRGDGSVVTYHNLQWWADGRNHSIHVPEGKVAEMEQAIESGRRLRELVLELSAADAAEIVSTASALKKNSRRSRSGGRPKSVR